MSKRSVCCHRIDLKILNSTLAILEGFASDKMHVEIRGDDGSRLFMSDD